MVAWVIPLVSLVASVGIPTLIDYFTTKQSVKEIEDAITSLVVEYVPGMTFGDFILDNWLYLLALGCVIYLSIKIAYPKRRKKYRTKY